MGVALFLTFGKRRHELLLLESAAAGHRPILSEYSPQLLDQMIAVVTAVGLTGAGLAQAQDGAALAQKSGCMTCCERSWVTLILRRSISGSVRKKSQFTRSCSRNGGCGRMLMALSLTSVLFLAGQTSTQMRQPVQSSGATCSENFMPLNSGTRASVLLKVAGAPVRCFAS